MFQNPHVQDRSPSRRQLLLGAAAGLAGLSTGNLLAATHPLAPRMPHACPRAQRVIWFFMTGGLSHVDSFDPRPQLQASDGKVYRQHGDQEIKFMASPWAMRRCGQSGLEITDLFPHMGRVADELCLVRSLHADHSDHFAATLHMHTGSDGSALPGIGAWISYGLGTVNRNLPSHVVFAKDRPYAGSQAWDAGFLPPHHQGTQIEPGDEPVANLTPDPQAAPYQAQELALLRRVNERHLATRRGDPALAARVQTFDSAYAMQRIAPDLFSLADESPATLEMYGLERGDTRSFAWQCLMARRMAEQGVRFIELIDTGSSNNWDSHGDIRDHGRLAPKIDRPIAALIGDLKQRGMLEDTLLVGCTEFGRSPYRQETGGRNHYPDVFTCWLAGGGTRGGYAHGSSDEYGLKPASDPVHVHDFHATILHLLGLDHQRLTYRHAGRDFRLTDVYGDLVHKLIA